MIRWWLKPGDIVKSKQTGQILRVVEYRRKDKTNWSRSHYLLESLDGENRYASWERNGLKLLDKDTAMIELL